MPRPRGRPAGSRNKLTREMKERIQQLLDTIEEEHLYADLAALDPDKRVNLYVSLLEYTTPKLARTELAGDSDSPVQIVFGVGIEEKG